MMTDPLKEGATRGGAKTAPTGPRPESPFQKTSGKNRPLEPKGEQPKGSGNHECNGINSARVLFTLEEYQAQLEQAKAVIAHYEGLLSQARECANAWMELYLELSRQTKVTEQTPEILAFESKTKNSIDNV